MARSAFAALHILHRRGVVLDFHYSGAWADPAHQTKPATWAGLSYPALRDCVPDYTGQVLCVLAAVSSG